jgi:type IV secretion system protein VirB9
MKTKTAFFFSFFFFLLHVVQSGSAQQTARIVPYHTNDIVPIRAKLRYTTLIQLPASEKIVEVATGDKDFWIIDVVNNFCFLHPAKEGIHSNLNLITDKANVYSFKLDDVEAGEPDLKIIVEPSGASSIASVEGPSKLVPASEAAAAQQEAQMAAKRAEQAVERFRSEYPTHSVKFDYLYRNKKPFRIAAIYEDGQFTYVRSAAEEKFAVYELADGKPGLIEFQLQGGTYVLPKVVDHGYLVIGKHTLHFDRSTDRASY